MAFQVAFGTPAMLGLSRPALRRLLGTCRRAPGACGNSPCGTAPGRRRGRRMGRLASGQTARAMVSGDDSWISSGPTTAALCNAYGFHDVDIAARLEGGYANDLFRIAVDGQAVVLRVKHPLVVEADIAWEHRLMRLLADRLPEVAAPIPTRGHGTVVRLGDRVGWLMPFIEGTPADPGRERHRLAAARAGTTAPSR